MKYIDNECLVSSICLFQQYYNDYSFSLKKSKDKKRNYVKDMLWKKKYLFSILCIIGVLLLLSYMKTFHISKFQIGSDYFSNMVSDASSNLSSSICDSQIQRQRKLWIQNYCTKSQNESLQVRLFE